MVGRLRRLSLDRNWAQAGERCLAFLQTYGEDAASRMLLAKCNRFLAEPPLGECDSAFVFEDK